MNPTPLSFNVQNNHPLIPREQYYTLVRKLVTIHSEDRDVCKWRDSNHFEIDLPETIKNIQSLRLAETSMPSNFYNISKQFQNTSLTYSVGGTTGPWKTHTIELCEGFYTPVQLACVLTKLMTPVSSVVDGLDASGEDLDLVDTLNSEPGITVQYDIITQNFVFSSQTPFLFDFRKQTCYVPDCNNTKPIWCQSTKWGLGSYLGFDKDEYSSVQHDNTSCNMPYCLSAMLQNPMVGAQNCEVENKLVQYGTLPSKDSYIIVAPKFPKLEGEQVIYMEVDKYNSYDELCPYPTQTNNMFNNTYGGNVNSAFAKIHLLNGVSGTVTSTMVDTKNNNLLNISHHDPPIEKIKKLKFKFRYHNGELVDFKDVPFTFTIEFNSLRNDIEKTHQVGVPYVYM